MSALNNDGVSRLIVSILILFYIKGNFMYEGAISAVKGM